MADLKTAEIRIHVTKVRGTEVSMVVSFRHEGQTMAVNRKVTLKEGDMADIDLGDASLPVELRET